MHVKQSKTSGTCWFGGYNVSINGTFKWIDNSEVDYTNWLVGQPDNSDPTYTEFCTWYGHNPPPWDDRPCELDIGWIKSAFLCHGIYTVYASIDLHSIRIHIYNISNNGVILNVIYYQCSSQVNKIYT